MSEHGELLNPETVRFVRLLPGPVDRVWSYLVNPDKRAKWLCGGSTELHVGGKIQLHFANERLSDEPDTEIPP